MHQSKKMSASDIESHLGNEGTYADPEADLAQFYGRRSFILKQ